MPRPSWITAAPLWQDRLRDFFPPEVLSRGEASFRQGRVALEKATPTAILALVDGPEEYQVDLVDDLDKGGSLRVLCDCPLFQDGVPCEHLWAAIIAADAVIVRKGGNASPAPSVAKPSPWRELLFPGGALHEPQPSRWEGAPGQFLLRYELWIDKGIRLSAIRRKVLKSGKLGAQTSAVSHKILAARRPRHRRPTAPGRALPGESGVHPGPRLPGQAQEES